MYQDPDVSQFLTTLGDGLFRQRRAFGMSTEQLAEKAKLSPRTVMVMEQKNGEPTVETMVAVVMALGGNPSHIAPTLDGLFYDGTIPLVEMIGVNVRHHRTRNFWSRTSLARRSRVSLLRLRKIEEFESKSLRVSTLMRLAFSIGVTMGDLLSQRDWEEKQRLLKSAA